MAEPRAHAPRRLATPVPRSAYPDLLAVAVLLLATAIVCWNRFVFDTWLARHDLLAFFLPWYHALGERLRDLDAPGWNPYIFSGAPFAGDPESGWMYLPAMVTFPFLSATAAFKAMVVVQLVVAGLSTYALARVLRMGAIASLVGAVVFEFGPFLYHNTDCCTVRAQVATFIPLALLGVELGLRQARWRDRIVPWFVGGFAISQILAGWLGQGALNALLLIAAYVAYRGLLSPPRPGRDILTRITTCVSTGVAVLVLGLLLGAAGVLPRLDVNQQTNLAGADYDKLGQGHAATPYTPALLFSHLTGDGPLHRAVALGGAAFMLIFLAPLLARRRYAVPYFAGLTVVVYALTQAWTPIHPLFFLIPRFKELHEHSPHQINAVVMIGPAMLSAAAVEALPRWRGHRQLLPFVLVPLLFFAMITVWLESVRRFDGWSSFVAAVVVSGLAVLVVCTPARTHATSNLAILARLAPLLILVVALIQPTGQELVSSLLGRTTHYAMTPFDESAAEARRAVEVSLAPDDTAGAGAFLQAEQAKSGPFRYVGYGGVGYSAPGIWQYSYQARRLRPDILQLLVNARSLVLKLQDIQGYNPIQLERYVEFITAMNGLPQNYHHANLLPSGTVSPLLNLLNVRYIIVDANLPSDRADVVALTAGRPAVFRSDQVVVYENPFALPRAWIVHDVWGVQRGDALRLLTTAGVDPRQTAFIESNILQTAPADDPSADRATVTRYEGDAIDIDTSSDAPGLLVVSEVYSEGWKAYVDGQTVDILPTDHVLRGIPLPAGQHRVALRYQPASLQIGLALTCISTLVMLALFGWSAWRRLRRPSTAGV